jgi:hypothetical protein
MKGLHPRLKWLWENRTSESLSRTDPELSQWRYIPRAFSSAGPGWGVYDQTRARFLSDREVVAVPMDELQNARRLAS